MKFLGYITIHKGILHIFLFPNENDTFGYYYEKDSWKQINAENFYLGKSIHSDECISMVMVCVAKKYSQMMLINDH